MVWFFWTTRSQYILGFKRLQRTARWHTLGFWTCCALVQPPILVRPWVIWLPIKIIGTPNHDRRAVREDTLRNHYLDGCYLLFFLAPLSWTWDKDEWYSKKIKPHERIWQQSWLPVYDHHYSRTTGKRKLSLTRNCRKREIICPPNLASCLAYWQSVKHRRGWTWRGRHSK